MKRLISSRAIAMLLTLFAMSGSTLFADVDDFELSVRNVTQPTANILEFDLYLLDTDGLQPFEFTALQMGLLLNSSIYGTGGLTVTYSNSGSGLNIDQQFAGTADVVGSLPGYPELTLIRLAANSIPPVPPGAGSGTVISSTGNGTFLAHFIITSSISFTPNTRPDLIFCASSAVSPLYPTVLSTYINGDATSLAVTPGLDAIVDGNPLLNATFPAIFNVTGTGTYCQGGAGLTVGLSGSESGTTYTLYQDGLEIATYPGTGAALFFGIRTAGTYTVRATNTAGDTDMNGQAVITATALPGPAGSISGPASFTPGTSDIGYSVSTITGATSYIWSYSGSGVTINGSGASVTLDFSASATPGTLSVFGRNSCGDGLASTLVLSQSTKTLTLTSVLLEGLYNGGGVMREVSNGYAPQYPGIADRVTIELHDAASYSTIIYSAANVNLSLNGTATVIVPSAFSGSYYITVKHRNSLETTTSSPISFAGTTINGSFAATANVFGGNLKSSGDGFYLIFGADVNQDGLVDTGDMNDVDNGSAAILIGYNIPDANGDGIVDTSDMNMVDNNSAAIVFIRIPF
jgi:PKD-like domain